jgi:signal transduction histidine kinase
MKELSEAQEEIIRRGRMSQLGQLIATVAHEIRNPLGAVKTGVFVLERRVKAEISAAFQNIATSAGDAAVPARKPEFDTQFQRINRGIARCDAIITQLLDFTRTATAQTELKEIDPWLSDVVDDLRHQLPPAVTIDLDLAMTGQTVAFDPVRIQRAVVNLVNNASEAMVGKGDDLSKYTTKNPRIIVATRLTGRGAEISVTDNGPGIQPEDLARIREPLFTTKSFGTGIGLPAVEKILEQHNGGLDISSAPGEGACFIAWFPVQNILKEAV